MFNDHIYNKNITNKNITNKYILNNDDNNYEDYNDKIDDYFKKKYIFGLSDYDLQIYRIIFYISLYIIIIEYITIKKIL
jgi:hypothetical protein